MNRHPSLSGVLVSVLILPGRVLEFEEGTAVLDQLTSCMNAIERGSERTKMLMQTRPSG